MIKLLKRIKLVELPKPLKNKKGMTLVEAVAGIMVFAVIAATVTTILVSVSKAYVKSNDLAETNLLLNNLSREVLSELRSASGVTVSGSKIKIRTGSKTVLYSVENGFLYRDETPVFDEKYYNGKTMALAYYADEQETEISPNPDEFIVRVKILSADNRVTISRDYAVKPLGLNAYYTK